jgi:hypothetical protein
VAEARYRRRRAALTAVKNTSIFRRETRYAATRHDNFALRSERCHDEVE